MIFATVWTFTVLCVPMIHGGYASGLYEPASQTIVLTAQLCRTLDRAPRYDRDNPATAMMAIFGLAHEEGHAHDTVLNTYRFGVPVDSPDYDHVANCGGPGVCEAYADCWAAGRMVALARTLGFKGYEARRFRNLAHRSRTQIGYETIPQRCWKETGAT